MAPFPFFNFARRLRPHLRLLAPLRFRHLRNAIPPALRQRYHDRLARFHLDILPKLKHGFQSRVYRYLVARQQRRVGLPRLADLAAKQARRLRGKTPPPAGLRPPNNARGRIRGAHRQRKMPSLGYVAGAALPTNEDGQQPSQGERGYRRRKLAEMAGNIYKSGQQAVTDIRDTYAQTRFRTVEGDPENRGSPHIPGAFPDVAIKGQGNEQMVLFPSYAKRHVKRDWSNVPPPQTQAQGQGQGQDQGQGQGQGRDGPIRDEEYWRQEFEKHEDEKAIVDVDVRGWIYTPQSGPMTRRNRILLGLARQLSGISAPKPESLPGTPPLNPQEDPRDQEKIAQEAAEIERRGQQEGQAARIGAYSEESSGTAGTYGTDSWYSRRSRRRGSQTPDSTPSSPLFGPRQQQTTATTTELTEAELSVANTNLLARIAPFMTNPLVSLPITIFFYNDDNSQSRTVLTNDAGHFNVRAALDFVPTGVRVLANEQLSATQEVLITEPHGVSVISDIDDTVKKSNISSGAREIFRNTFIRDLGGLTVEGVQDWYNEMHKLDVRFHYCSNSPWQLFPVLSSFFKLGGLPPGSLHLKQYSGMLQGIFEPVAERKKSSLARLLRDFPERKFLLVGDSGEADLEVYTELAVANPGRILAVFIRDVTTPDRPGYFDAAYDFTRQKFAGMSTDNSRQTGDGPPRQNSAPAMSPAEEKAPSGPAMGTLIDFTEEPEQVKADDTSKKSQSAVDLLSARKPAPPRPAKPAALRSLTAANPAKSDSPSSSAPPPKPPRPSTIAENTPASNQRLPTRPAQSSTGTSRTASEADDAAQTAKSSPDLMPPPLPRRRTPASLRTLSPRLFGGSSHNRNSSVNADVDFEPLPPAANPVPGTGTGAGAAQSGMSYYRSGTRSGGVTPSGSPTMGPQGVNRKLDLWRRRVARAHEQLEQLGVVLYTWRRGQDVASEAIAIVKRELEEGGGGKTK